MQFYQQKIINKNSNILILFGDVPLVNLNTLIKMKNNYFNNNKNGSMLAFNSSKSFCLWKSFNIKK